jgi:hypothetical protein
VNVSYLPDPQQRADWGLIEALLQPAVDDGQETFDPDIDVCWAIYDGGTLYGAATTRLRLDGDAELRLAGGHEFRRWIGLLDETVTNWARDAAASRLMMRGRKGWARFAERFGWDASGIDDDGKELFSKDL